MSYTQDLVQDYIDVCHALYQQESQDCFSTREHSVYLRVKRSLLEEELMSLMGVHHFKILQERVQSLIHR